MKYINISDQPRRVVRHRVKVLIKPGDVINLETTDINHSSSALRFFEPYVEGQTPDERAPDKNQKTAENQQPDEDQWQGEDQERDPENKEEAELKMPVEEEKADGQTEIPKSEVILDSEGAGEQVDAENTKEDTGESEKEQKVEEAEIVNKEE